MFDQLVHLLAREGDAGVERPTDPTERGLDLDNLSRATMLNSDPDSAASRERRQRCRTRPHRGIPMVGYEGSPPSGRE